MCIRDSIGRGATMTDLKEMRVLIAEDQALVRQGMRALLSDYVGNIVEVADGVSALKTLKSEPFDVALLDIGLPRRTGLDVMQELRTRKKPLKIIIMTGDTNSYSPNEILSAGADGFLYKTADAAQLLETFKAIACGKTPSSASMNNGETASEVGRLRESLTEREIQIVKLVVEGCSNKMIAKTLFISEHTVRKHREHINNKLNIRSPMAMANFAIKAALV